VLARRVVISVAARMCSAVSAVLEGCGTGVAWLLLRVTLLHRCALCIVYVWVCGAVVHNVEAGSGLCDGGRHCRIVQCV